MTKGQLGTGYLPSAIDFRDTFATTAMLPSLAVALQPNFDIDLTVLGPVLMQGQTPSCVSHSVALLLKHYWFKKTGKVVNFSPRFLDILVKRFDGLGDPTNRAVQGTYPRMVLKLAVQYGCATEATLPNDTTLPTLQYRDDALLTDKVFAEAAKYKIPGFIRVPDDFYAMRAAVQVMGPLSMGLYLGSEWWLPSWAKKDINPLRTPKQIVSGHQVVAKGWGQGTLNRLRNSWSEPWCDKGEADYDAVEWGDFIQEAWAIADVPKDVKNFLRILPSPQDFHYTFNTNLHQDAAPTQDIEMLQVAYMILGYLKPIAPDEFGTFGPKTAAANLHFQLDNKIAPTAPDTVGPLTRAALNKRFAL